MGLSTFSINVTLDGCVDQQESIADDESHGFFTRLTDEAGATLWGRVTYEMMESYWPTVARGDVETPPAMRQWAVQLEAKPKQAFAIRKRSLDARVALCEAAPEGRGRPALPARADSEQPRRRSSRGRRVVPRSGPARRPGVRPLIPTRRPHPAAVHSCRCRADRRRCTPNSEPCHRRAARRCASSPRIRRPH